MVRRVPLMRRAPDAGVFSYPRLALRIYKDSWENETKRGARGAERTHREAGPGGVVAIAPLPCHMSTRENSSHVSPAGPDPPRPAPPSPGCRALRGAMERSARALLQRFAYTG